jgi:hypothetical protein
MPFVCFVEVQATVATMSGKLSSLKRASRSLAKTGLLGGSKSMAGVVF